MTAAGLRDGLSDGLMYFMADSSTWISVGQLSEAFHADSYAPTVSSDLVGRTLNLAFQDGRSATVTFHQQELLTWDQAGGPGSEGAGEQHCRAAKLRDGIYLVDFVWLGLAATTITLFLDLTRKMGTILIGSLPDDRAAHRPLLDRIDSGDELTGVSATFVSVAINRPFTDSTPRHLSTGDMVGRRVEYTYSASERYEHIYLNESFYTWHCLEGSEKGLADTDRCHYFKLADDLYLFVWREKIVPTLGVVTVDFAAMRTAGKILGYAGDAAGALANFPVGARARILNVTAH